MYFTHLMMMILFWAILDKYSTNPTHKGFRHELMAYMRT